MQRVSRNLKGRDFAVGDIHGCFSALQHALQSVQFNESIDRLFSVGDLVDRGPESHLVLHWLAKPWFYAVCGNHDFMAWRAALGDPYPEVDHNMHGGDWLDALDENQLQKIAIALKALPLAMEVETSLGNIGMVHADCPFDDWNQMHLAPWHNISHISKLGDYSLWGTVRHAKQYKTAIKNVRAVVHGHVVLRQPQVLGNVYFIDTGGWREGGSFTLLELEPLTLHFKKT